MCFGKRHWDLLVQMGAQRDHLSVRQTAQTAAALARDPTQTMLLKQAYYDSIVESGSTWIRVEKNIRAVIRSIHQAGSPLYRTLLEAAALGGPAAQQPGFSVEAGRAAEGISPRHISPEIGQAACYTDIQRTGK